MASRDVAMVKNCLKIGVKVSAVAYSKTTFVGESYAIRQIRRILSKLKSYCVIL